MVVDGQHEVILQSLLAAVGAIDATVEDSEFHYGGGGRSVVFPCAFYSKAFWSDEFDVIFMVRPSSMTWEAAMCDWNVRREFFVMATRRDTNAEALPWIAAPTDTELPAPATESLLPTSVQNRLVDDVQRAILADPTLGGVADDVQFEETTNDYYVTGWVCVEMRMAVLYRVPRERA